MRKRLASRLRRRLRQYNRQRRLFLRTHRRSHQRAARKDRRAIRYLRHLIRKARRHKPTVMYDSIDPSQIPKDAEAVAGYVGGNWPTFHLLDRRFPHARRLSIAISASEDAECLDVEPGDATVGQAPAWVHRQVGREVKRPVIYTSASNMDAVLSALRAAGIGRHRVKLWAAHYGAGEHRCGPRSCGLVSVTVDATQWSDNALGRNLDVSVLAPDFF